MKKLTYRDYTIIALALTTTSLTYKLAQKSNEGLTCPTRDVVEIVTNTNPLPISQDLKNFLIKNEIVAITVGYKNNTASLISTDGDFLNPCIDFPNQPCHYDGVLIEAHAYIAKRSGHGGGSGYPCPKLCKGLDNINHSCSGGNWYCSSGNNPCQTTCKLP